MSERAVGQRSDGEERGLRSERLALNRLRQVHLGLDQHEA